MASFPEGRSRFSSERALPKHVSMNASAAGRQRGGAFKATSLVAVLHALGIAASSKCVTCCLDLFKFYY